MQNIYIGSFPINGGGVTNKNRDLYDALILAGVKISKLDLNDIKSKKNVKTLFGLALALINRSNRFVVGISTGKNTRRNFCRLLYMVNRKSMKKSILIMMGGNDNNNIIRDQAYAKWIACYQRVYVETEGMKQSLESIGLNNIAIYPNCRFRPKADIIPKDNAGNLRCVFFSFIQPEKGIDLVLNAAKSLPSVQFFVYGRVAEDYQTCFETNVNALSNVSYMGNFQGSSEEVYAELSKYDILLLPTKWNSEGVPGVLVEGKIAGLAEIVSNKSYNAEIVRNGIEGFVLEENSGEELCAAIKGLQRDRDLLAQIKAGSKKSAERFYIENYIGAIKKVLEERV